MSTLPRPGLTPPRIAPSAGLIARTRGLSFLPDGIPVAGIAGDQHAALFGQACFAPGDAKCTYGTGAFLLVNTGLRGLSRSRFGLLSAPAWKIGDQVTYALEGSVFIAQAAPLCGGCATVSGMIGLRLRDRSPLQRESVPTSGGVVFVPALAGLRRAVLGRRRAPGLFAGLTRGTTRAHLAARGPRGNRLSSGRCGAGDE